MSNAIARLSHAEKLLFRMIALPFREEVCPVFPCADPKTSADATREYQELRRDVLAHLNRGGSRT